MNDRFWGAAFYFFYFGALGCWFPYLNLHYQQIGLAKQQIGLLAALPTLISLFASPAWAGLADKLRIHKRLLTAAMLLTPIALVLVVQAKAFGWLIVFVTLQALLSAPISPLADNAVLELLGEERHRYSSLRLWGAVGFGITALGGGFIIERVGIGWAAGAYVVLMWVAAFITTRLPAPQQTAPPQLRDLGLITRDARWFWFLVALMLVGFCATLFLNFMALYLSQLGGSSGWFGITILVASISELFVFAAAPRIIQKGHARTLLMVSFGTYALRALITSFIHDPYLGIIPQAMHGLCFAALWSASVAYARQIVPPGWNATAQSLISVLHFGVGAGGGALLAGALYDGIGPVVLFRLAGVSAAAGLLAFAITQRHQTDTPHPPRLQDQTSR